MPTGAVLLITQVVRRAADYGLFKPAREMLFTVLGNALYLAIATLGISGIAWLCAAACGLLILCIRWLGAGFAARESRTAGEAQEEPRGP